MYILSSYIRIITWLYVYIAILGIHKDAELPHVDSSYIVWYAVYDMIEEHIILPNRPADKVLTTLCNSEICHNRTDRINRIETSCSTNICVHSYLGKDIDTGCKTVNVTKILLTYNSIISI